MSYMSIERYRSMYDRFRIVSICVWDGWLCYSDVFIKSSIFSRREQSSFDFDFPTATGAFFSVVRDRSISVARWAIFVRLSIDFSLVKSSIRRVFCAVMNFSHMICWSASSMLYFLYPFLKNAVSFIKAIACDSFSRLKVLYRCLKCSWSLPRTAINLDLKAFQLLSSAGVKHSIRLEPLSLVRSWARETLIMFSSYKL